MIGLCACRELTSIFPGSVRKQLGLSFLGETREEGQLVLGLVQVKGLETEVRADAEPADVV